VRLLCDKDARCNKVTTKEAIMLWTIFVVLLVLWALGFVSGYAIGGFIHLLLVIAVVVLLIQLIQGRSSI
jgi:fatty acid desaturase